MEFEDKPLPKRVETLYDNGVFAVGVAAGAEHALVADAKGAVWGFGTLNAIGALNNPSVTAMRDAEKGSAEGDSRLISRMDYEDDILDEGLAFDRNGFSFLFPHGCANISLPVRVPVDVRGEVLRACCKEPLSSFPSTE
jgi:hypothetical protein